MFTKLNFNVVFRLNASGSKLGIRDKIQPTYLGEKSPKGLLEIHKKKSENIRITFRPFRTGNLKQWVASLGEVPGCVQGVEIWRKSKKLLLKFL